MMKTPRSSIGADADLVQQTPPAARALIPKNLHHPVPIFGIRSPSRPVPARRSPVFRGNWLVAPHSPAYMQISCRGRIDRRSAVRLSTPNDAGMRPRQRAGQRVHEPCIGLGAENPREMDFLGIYRIGVAKMDVRTPRSSSRPAAGRGLRVHDVDVVHILALDGTVATIKRKRTKRADDNFQLTVQAARSPGDPQDRSRRSPGAGVGRVRPSRRTDESAIIEPAFRTAGALATEIASTIAGTTASTSPSSSIRREARSSPNGSPSPTP